MLSSLCLVWLHSRQLQCQQSCSVTFIIAWGVRNPILREQSPCPNYDRQRNEQHQQLNEHPGSQLFNTRKAKNKTTMHFNGGVTTKLVITGCNRILTAIGLCNTPPIKQATLCHTFKSCIGSHPSHLFPLFSCKLVWHALADTT